MSRKFCTAPLMEGHGGFAGFVVGVSLLAVFFFF